MADDLELIRAEAQARVGEHFGRRPFRLAVRNLQVQIAVGVQRYVARGKRVRTGTASACAHLPCVAAELDRLRVPHPTYHDEHCCGRATATLAHSETHAPLLHHGGMRATCAQLRSRRASRGIPSQWTSSATTSNSQNLCRPGTTPASHASCRQSSNWPAIRPTADGSGS